MNKRIAAVMEFNADPAHRRMLRIVVVVVVLAGASCPVCIWSLPTQYCNYLIPAILGCSIISLIIISRRYGSWVTWELERRGLICEHCGRSTIPRPDEVALSASDKACGAEVCYHCNAELASE
ncbi:MAG: hypothetical protein L7W43_10940 [Rubripirellula sp.]|nr:hypothetical protein [Rubripirellula sp.]